MADSPAGIVKRIWAAIADCFQKNPRPLTMGQARAWISENYREESFDPNTVYQQIRGSCGNIEASLRHRKNVPKILIYDEASRTYRLAGEEEIAIATTNNTADLLSDDEDDSSDSSEQNSTFALESHLRDFLARNLSSVIEEGMQLWSHDPPTVEFSVERRRIDVLAKDRHGVPVVIEIKLNSAYDRVIGQALLYRALVRKRLGVERVRLILVGNEISDDLRAASEDIKDVELFEYKMSFKLIQVARR